MDFPLVRVQVAFRHDSQVTLDCFGYSAGSLAGGWCDKENLSFFRTEKLIDPIFHD